MNQPARFDPFGQLLRGFFHPDFAEPKTGARPIRIDVSENEKAYTVHAEVPGVAKDDIAVQVDGKQVSITTEIKRENANEGARVLHAERYAGKAYRGFVLGDDIDEAAVEARYANGVLELVLPKKARPAARQVTVH